jgi:nitrilase
MTTVRIAAVQATYELMDRAATIERVSDLTADAARQGAQLVVFPEAFIPGTPIWIDTQPIWDGDDEWYRLLAEQAVTVPGAATERLGAVAEEHGTWLVVGVQELETGGGTIYNSVLYFSPDGTLVEKHRKLVPTGSERTIWGMGDGSTLRAVAAPFGRIGGLICWENYMPLARFHLYAQGIDIWLAPTLATGDAWVASMRHLARENRMYVVGVNPVLHIDRIPAGFPDRDRLVPPSFLGDHAPWVEEGNTVIVGPKGDIIAGPVRQREETVFADLDMGAVTAARRFFDPVGHYNRPDVFRLQVDTSPRTAVIESARD